MREPGKEDEKMPERDTPEYALWVLANSNLEVKVTTDGQVKDLRDNKLDLRGVENIQPNDE